MNNELYVSTKVISATSGYDVEWNGYARIVSINTSKNTSVSTTKPVIVNVQYDNITNEVLQIQSYINNGMYLEAMQLCDLVIIEHTISPNDKSIISKLHIEAEAKYQDYLSSSKSVDVQYDNVIDQLYQVVEYFNKGMYLEAIQVCEQTSEWYNLSPSDEARFNDLRNLSYMNYQDYLNEQSKWETYYDGDWGMRFIGVSKFKPVRLGDRYDGLGDCIEIYNNTASFLTIRSCKVGERVYELFKITTPSSFVSNHVAMMRELAREDMSYHYGGTFEVLSENYTQVGNFNAVQATYRYSANMNRYGTVQNHTIGKVIVFQYGEWIYVIEGREKAYLWSDEFWNIMEKVRTTISF